jgi:hypothetical protein
MESSGEDLKRADEAERQLTELIRQLGHDALTGWAEQRVAAETERGQALLGWRSAGEKNFTGIVPTGLLKSESGNSVKGLI